LRPRAFFIVQMRLH